MNTTNLATFPRYATAGRQVREDPGVYSPDRLKDEHSDGKHELPAAAADHAAHLSTAQRIVGEALNLSGLVLASLHDECDKRAMQIGAALKIIEKKLEKACDQLDRHEVQYANLIPAYVDLRKQSGGEESS